MKTADTKTRSVEYMGSTYEVPEWAGWLASDPDGSVWAFEEEPLWLTPNDVYSTGEGRITCVGKQAPLPPLKCI